MATDQEELSPVQHWIQTFKQFSPEEQAQARRLFFQVSNVNKPLLKAHRGSDAGLENTYIDFVWVLPEVLAMMVLEFCEAKDVGNSLLVSRRWNDRCISESSNYIWEKIYRTNFASSSYLDNKERQWVYGWYNLWCLQYVHRHMWMHGNVESSVFLGHTDRVRNVRVRSSRFISASWDGSIRVGRVGDETHSSRMFAGHAGSVFGAWFNGEVAGTCSEDSTIRVWQVTKGKCVAELKGHSSAVYRAELIDSDTLVSCSSDFVGIWKWKTGTLQSKLNGHAHDVHRLQVKKPYIVTGSYDKTVCVWEYPSCTLKWRSAPCHDGGVSCLHFSSNLLVTGSAKGEVYVWDLKTGRQPYSLNYADHGEALVTCVWSEKDVIASTSIVSLSSAGGITCFWCAKTGKLLQRIDETAYVNAWTSEQGLLFCAYSDGHLRIRDLSDNLNMVMDVKHGRGPLYDVDVQGNTAVTCGLDRRVIVWTVSDASNQDPSNPSGVETDT